MSKSEVSKNGKNGAQEKLPVYFMDLVVENVACFKERQQLDLSDDEGKPASWTVILGDNGTGKTVLLKCLTFFLTSLEDDFINGTGANWKRYEPVLNGKDDFLIENEQIFRGRLNGLNHKLEAGLKLMPSYPGIPYVQSHLDKNWNGKIPVTYAYGVSRSMGSGSIKETKSYDPTSSLFSENMALINAEAWLLEAAFATKLAKDEVQDFAFERYERIKTTLIEILPEVSDFRVKPLVRENLSPAMQALTPYGWVDMSALSQGYQTTIALLVDIAARQFDRYPDSDNPLAEPAIVLIDEIDLHLHPQWQRTVMQQMTDVFPNTQFIVTAHSPLIVQAAEGANIVLLQREGDQVKIHNRMQVKPGARIDEILTSDLYGLVSARPPRFDDLLLRRREILAKPHLAPKDEKELQAIGAKLEQLDPVFENEENSEAFQILRRASELLKSASK